MEPSDANPTSYNRKRSKMLRRRDVLALLLPLIGIGCKRAVPDRAHSIVGAWLVSMPEAPFPYHMFVFHSDGTVVQSNPDAGDRRNSDSNLIGVWVPDQERIKGRLVEVTADRTSGLFTGRVEVTFVLAVDGDTLRGSATGIVLDAEGRQVRDPIKVSVAGQRVMP